MEDAVAAAAAGSSAIQSAGSGKWKVHIISHDRHLF
jgi:hypothetical protein